MEVLNQLFSTFKVSANIMHNGQYCGNWAVDTSGTHYMSFHIVSHGRCFLTVNNAGNTTTSLEAGDIVLFPRDISHCLTNDESFSQPINQAQSLDFASGPQTEGTGLVCGYFEHNHPLMYKMTEHLPDHLIVRNSHTQTTSLSLLLQALLQESIGFDKGSTLIMAKLSEAILAILFRDHLPSDSGLLAALMHPKLARVLERIHEKPSQKWTVDELAQISFLSRAGFAELFKTVVGQTPMEYITHWRLSLAYRMLADEKVSTLHAAIESGYDNESSFSKAFKRVMGISPGALRAGQQTN